MTEILALLQALLLGVAQGLTEFLPVSSSAHLETLPWLFGFDTPGKVFDTSLHLGTVAALLLFFYKDFVGILSSYFKKADKEVVQKRRLGIGIFIAILPAGILGVVFDNAIETMFDVSHQPMAIYVVITMLIFFGILLYLADKYGKKHLSTEQLVLPQMFLIGVMQAFALVPGVSRSGVTMTAAMAAGMVREEAAKLSFLIGTPIILAAGIYKLKDLVGMSLSLSTVMYFAVGMIASAVTGYFCIKYFLDFLGKQDTRVFLIYRVLFALLLFVVAYVTLGR